MSVTQFCRCCSLLLLLSLLASCRAPFVPTPSSCRDLIGSAFSGGRAGLGATPPAPGYGQSSNQSSDSRRADKLLRKGIDKYNDGDLRGAATVLSESYALQPSKDGILYAARSLRYTGCVPEAATLYQQALYRFRAELRPDERADAAQFLDSLERAGAVAAPPSNSTDAVTAVAKEEVDRKAQEAARKAELEAAERNEREQEKFRAQQRKDAAARISSAVLAWLSANVQISITITDNYRDQCENDVGTIVRCDSGAARRKVTYQTTSATATVRNSTTTEISCKLHVHGWGNTYVSEELKVKKGMKKFLKSTPEYLPVTLGIHKGTALVGCTVPTRELFEVSAADSALVPDLSYKEMGYFEGKWEDPANHRSFQDQILDLFTGH